MCPNLPSNMFSYQSTNKWFICVTYVFQLYTLYRETSVNSSFFDIKKYLHRYIYVIGVESLPMMKSAPTMMENLPPWGICHNLFYRTIFSYLDNIYHTYN